MDRSRGFSLIELLIVLALTAILATLAMGSYNRYQYRARRVEGQHALLTLAHAEERWYATYNRYTGDLTQFGYDTNPAFSPHGFYTVMLSLSDDTGQGYVAEAIPSGTQADDACGVLMIDNSGSKKPAPSDAETYANGACW